MEALHRQIEELPQNSPSDLDTKSQENMTDNYKIMAQVEELESKFDRNPDGSEKWQRLVDSPIEDQYGQIWMIWENPAASLSNPLSNPKSRYQMYTILQDDMFEDEGDTKNPTIEAYKKFGQAAISTVWSVVKLSMDFKYVIVNDASCFDYSRIFKEYSTKTYEFEVGHDKDGMPILLDVVLNDDNPPICVYRDQVREYEESLIENASLGIKHQGREESLKKVFSDKVWQKLGAASIDSLTTAA
ncbi:MAG: hypothetical protein NNC24_02765 [Candidatus Nanosynbacter sp. P11B_S7_bin.28.1]|nr:hypothetical protein [Candidatus Nanosynbacter sp. P11B_S7_bin.28.1]